MNPARGDFDGFQLTLSLGGAISQQPCSVQPVAIAQHNGHKVAD